MVENIIGVANLNSSLCSRMLSHCILYDGNDCFIDSVSDNGFSSWFTSQSNFIDLLVIEYSISRK